MAFINNPDDEEEILRQEGQPLTLAGEQGVGAAGPGTGAQGQQGDPGYVDTNAYLQANKEAAMDTANRVSGVLADQATKLRSDVSGLGETFQGEIQSGRVDLDNEFLGRAFGDPSSFVDNEEDLGRFKTMRDASYAGPTSFQDREDYTATAENVRKGVERAQSVDTPEGRTSLLYDVAKNPTRGMVALDELLIGGRPEARAKLSEAAEPFSSLTSYLDEIVGSAQTGAEEAKTATDATRAATREQLTGSIGSLEADIGTRVEESRAEAKQRAEAAQALLNRLQDVRLEGETFDPQVLADLGLTQEDLAKIALEDRQLKSAGRFYNPAVESNIIGTPEGRTRPNDDLKAWWMQGEPAFYNRDFDAASFGTMRAPETAFGMSEVASAEDYARAAALAQMSDQTDLGFLSPEDAAKAGTADLDIYDFDAAGAGQASEAQLRDRDRFAISALMGRAGQGVTDDDIRAWMSGSTEWLDNISRGGVQYHASNPVANASGLAGIRALARQGFYTLPDGSVLRPNL